MAGHQWPAGWYDDDGRMRWWDGSAWTEHVLDQQPVRRPRQTAPDRRSAASASKSSKDGRPLYKKKRLTDPDCVGGARHRQFGSGWRV